MKSYKKEIFFGVLILLAFGILACLETQLPFFKKFLPIEENKLIVVILNINLLLILLLLFLVSRTFIKGYIERKRGIWGSRLKTKLTLTLLFVSIIPSVTLYVLAAGFFQISMDKWFGQRIEDTLESAVEFSNFYYEDLFQRHERITTVLVKEITRRKLMDDDAQLARYITASTNARIPEYLSIHDLSGNILASNRSLGAEIREKLIRQARSFPKSERLRSILPIRRGELVIAGVRIIDQTGQEKAILLVGEAIRIHGTEKIKEIAAASKEIKESRPFKKILKYSFYIPLTLITLMTVFFSVWVGIKMASDITVPMERLKEGTAFIAKGTFDISLEDTGRDEIGTLVSAFNSMAKELKATKGEIEEKRRYLEVILDNVATGIISTNKTGIIIFLNRAAQNILGMERETWAGVPLREVFGDHFRKHMRMFLKEARAGDGRSITREMRLNLKNDVTYVRASLTILKDQTARVEGFVIAFDDITHIVRAERLATWREVAKKLTHEIKNPLTPIMLSTERIRRRLLPHAQGREKEVLDDTTSVIIRSVDDIKQIVNELTRLTHNSQTKTIEDINAVVEETLTLYKHLFQNISFESAKESIPPLSIEREGLKRALINLITNAAKAIEGNQGMIAVSTRYDEDRGIGVIEVADTGKGIPDEDKGRIFDPYFTKEKDGMGLGLAIVHSFVLEHHGKIRVEDNKPHGTKFIIELPVVEA
ncbi:MAG: PAS domain S-box protein [Syntrophorhabdus aromaticivorans]|uniref:histidine kinase n=1 Tax=Syntrophorhabdus aromaticivorans TaxID=328301 RepID=A0A971M6C0_9BACT|nr:PAS domain S-box protein [Syntrophorhabdus aromaticivorans]